MTAPALGALRDVLGRSAALWAGSVTVEPDRWVAFSGARGVDYNLVVCHGDPAGDALARSLRDVTDLGAPGLIMVADRALGGVGTLVEASWVCVGSVPLMRLALVAPAPGAGGRAGGPEPAPPVVRRLEATELPAARALVAEVFGIPDALALVALPDDAADGPGRTLWGSFADDGSLASCLALVVVGDVATVWSMATAATARRRAHGVRVLLAALDAARAAGATSSVLNASAAGEPFYRALGYEQLERWQVWSRPRWVLGRA